jgi:hypothetical protein
MLKTAVFYISIALNIGLLGWLTVNAILSDPELANKGEWSILQTLESVNRGKSMDDVLFEKNYNNSGYDAVGILDTQTHERVWILSNANRPPMIKLLPRVTRITITDDQIKRILNSVRVNEDTKFFLSTKRN